MTAHRVALGKISGVYGVQGWVKVHSFTRPIQNLLRYRQWWIAKGEGYEARLVSGKVHVNSVIAQITGKDGEPITDRDVAAGLLGSEILVERKAFPKLPKGQYYWVDLIGLAVVNEQGETLGEVTDVTSNGAQDVLVMKHGAAERFIPFVHGHIIQSVDPDARRIVCNWSTEDFNED